MTARTTIKAAPLGDVQHSANVGESRQQMIFRGCSFTEQEIATATRELTEKTRILDAAVKTLSENFNAQKMVEIKLACESAAAVAEQVETRARQIAALSKVLAGTFTAHLNRRPRT